MNEFLLNLYVDPSHSLYLANFSHLKSKQMGTMGVQMIGDACQSSTNPEDCMDVASPFVTILNILMSLKGFPEVAAIMLYCAALAAVMSTTDSVLISMSQIVTSDILYPMRPNSTPQQVAWMGRGVSVVISALSLILAMS